MSKFVITKVYIQQCVDNLNNMPSHDLTNICPVASILGDDWWVGTENAYNKITDDRFPLPLHVVDWIKEFDVALHCHNTDIVPELTFQVDFI